MEYPLSYREVIPDQTILDSWKEINLNTGGTQSILQDIKFIDRANGFCYKTTNKYYTRNRIIYWRTSNDTLELIELSLDINLTGNRVRYKFIDTPILDGISIHETRENIIILVPTVCSVHRLVFPHPDKFHRSDDLLGVHADLLAPSIFSEVSEAEQRNSSSYYVFSSPSFASGQLPYLACSELSNQGEAIFVLVYPAGELLLVKQSLGGDCSAVELKSDTIVPRFLSGLAEKFRSKSNDGDNVVSLLLYSTFDETYVITFTRDGHLKFWSCNKGQCVAIINILAEIGENTESILGAQNHVLRKAVNELDECVLAVFINYSSQCRFHIFETFFNNSQIRVLRKTSLYSPENDLIDFSLTTSRIWSIWRKEDGDCAVYSAIIQQEDNEVKTWTPVVLESPPENQIHHEGESDPSQVYLDSIFYPGRFPMHIITKALNIYRRSTLASDINLSPNILRQRISMAVQQEIQKELKDSEATNDDYIDCATWCWQRFYTCCEQYHLAGLKPLGILLLPNMSGAVLLKKSTFSFLRPLDPLEHMFLCSDYLSEDQFLNTSLFEDMHLVGDILDLIEVVVYLGQQMSEAFNYRIEKELFLTRSPDIIMAELLEKIITEMDSAFITQVSTKLNNCNNLYPAMHKLLELIRWEIVDTDKKGSNSIIAHLFNSQLGVDVVSKCLHQQSQTRYSICLDLLLICNILLKQEKLEWKTLEAIRSVCVPEIVFLTQATFAVVWLGTLTAMPVISNDLPSRRLAPLRLAPVFNLRNTNVPISVLQMFIGSTGGQHGHKMLVRNIDTDIISSHWHDSLLQYLNYLWKIIWPVSQYPLLEEWLLSSGQFIWLQQYVRLLKNWCEWNSCTRNFLLACSLLLSGENYKAIELFKSASKGIGTDMFLEQKILKNQVKDGRITISYYLKVIQLFELNNASDCTINMANTALSIVDHHDPIAATLYSIKFKHHLKLKHYRLAYDALNSNPEEERKRDNLRDLVKTLLDERKLDMLMTFDYGVLEELFCEILLTRARAADVINNIFYEFLYSYHIKRGSACFRLAASVMYEHAFRLTYNPNIEALEKQVKCYLAAINILSLCDDKFTWVARPKEAEDDEVLVFPKRIGSDEEDKQITFQNQVEVVDLQEIRNEFEFACARLKLAKFCPNVYNNLTITLPNELVVALVSSGLFQVALKFCKAFSLQYEVVFEGLTRRCVLLTEDESADPHSWEWLLKNDTQDLLSTNTNAADVSWMFLEQLLNEYEEPEMSTLHKVVCKKIIEMQMFVPHWLLASYKQRNPSELIKLLHSNGRLHEAVEIASTFMLAVMGHGKEYFGLKTALCPTGPVMYTPVGAISNLIMELELQQQENNSQDFLKEHTLLKDLFEKYIETATRISVEMCRYRYSLVK